MEQKKCGRSPIEKKTQSKANTTSPNAKKGGIKKSVELPTSMYKGKKKGTPNQRSKEVSSNLLITVNEFFDNAMKYMPVISPERKVSETRKIIEKVLNKCSPEIREEIADRIYLGFKRHLEKLPLFFNHIPIEKKFTESRLMLALLKPEHMKELGEYLVSKIPKTGK